MSVCVCMGGGGGGGGGGALKLRSGGHQISPKKSKQEGPLLFICTLEYSHLPSSRGE